MDIKSCKCIKNYYQGAESIGRYFKIYNNQNKIVTSLEFKVLKIFTR